MTFLSIHILSIITLLLYCGSLSLFAYTLINQNSVKLDNSARLILLLGFLIHLVFTILFNIKTDSYVIGIADSFSIISLLLLGLYFALYYSEGSKRGPKKIKGMEIIVVPVVLFFFILSSLVFHLDSTTQVSKDQLSSVLLIHIALIICAYVILSFSFVSSIALLIHERLLKLKKFHIITSRFPSLIALDSFISKSIMLGILLLSFGVLLGLYHSLTSQILLSQALDFKILSSLAVIILYVFLYYQMSVCGVRGRKASFYAIACYSLVLLILFYNYLGYGAGYAS